MCIRDSSKSIAIKNGYALLGKKNYLASAAFFILAGQLQNAVNILLDNQQDIQLAILCCRIIEIKNEKPIFNSLIQTHFIETSKLTNDFWLSHIGYYLLNQHIDSVNCLYEFGQYSQNSDYVNYNSDDNLKSCQTWPSKFDPLLSSYHPSVVTFVAKLKDSINVKRELQEQEYAVNQEEDIFESFWGEETKEVKEVKDISKKELIQNLSLLLELSLEYYLIVNNPTLGLMFFLGNWSESIDNKKIEQLKEQLLMKQVELILQESLLLND
eukprot:TRINITY_DN36177_c0_g1_i2.p1 TRINITY_DN36177_c0_g1~~TRINITY_DN36177_c0_g1_i2.p1  ORF type:complete len:269 (-),score=44.43 TRINITY_DN36177_c0_g1_i2:841-1647(-)